MCLLERLTSALHPIATTRRTFRHVAEGPLAAVSRCSELSYEAVRGLRPKSKTAWEHPHTAHNAQLEMPDRSGAEHKPVRRGREMIDLLAVEEPKPKPAKIRAVSYEAGSSSCSDACGPLTSLTTERRHQAGIVNLNSLSIALIPLFVRRSRSSA